MKLWEARDDDSLWSARSATRPARPLTALGPHVHMAQGARRHPTDQVSKSSETDASAAATFEFHTPVCDYSYFITS